MHDKPANDADNAKKKAQEPANLKESLYGCGGLILVIGVVGAMVQNLNSCMDAHDAAEEEVRRRAMIVNMPVPDGLAAMRAKIDAVFTAPLPLDPDIPEVKMFGRAEVRRGNPIREWAGLAAAQSESCDKIVSLDTSSRAKKGDLVWTVKCANGEMFIINEEQAQRVRVRYDRTATAEDRKTFGGRQTAAEPVSVAWKSFSDIKAVTNCDILLQSAAINRKSFDTEGRWDVARDEEMGLATITRGYSAQNAFGGTISGTYECIVRPSDNGVLSLQVTDISGTQKVY